MSGIDTSRGFAFQHAYAVHLLLDMVEDPTIVRVRLEGADDSVDAEAFNQNDERLYAVQAKTRVEPYTWSPSDIVPILLNWRSNVAAARYEFVSDGSAAQGYPLTFWSH